MNRFAQNNRHFGKYILSIFSLALLLCVLFLFLLSIDNFKHNSILRQQKVLEQAIAKDIAHCYALEGTYPASLSYLKEHYGLLYDQDLFFVDYQPIGANLYPDVTIVLKGEAKE